MDNSSKGLTGAAIFLILAVGIIHLIDAPSSFDDATYKGILFVANGLGAMVAAVGIFQGQRTWGWGLGTLIAAGSFIAYVYSRTMGLPGLDPDEWLEPLGVVSLVVEAAFVGLAVYTMPRAVSLRRA